LYSSVFQRVFAANNGSFPDFRLWEFSPGLDILRALGWDICLARKDL
jgi:hypothetical protein